MCWRGILRFMLTSPQTMTDSLPKGISSLTPSSTKWSNGCQTQRWPSSGSRQIQDSLVNSTWAHCWQVYLICRKHQARRATLWFTISWGQAAGCLVLRFTACKWFLIIWLLTLVCVAICSWCHKALAVVVLVCRACLSMSSCAVVTWGQPLQFPSWKHPVAWTAWPSLIMTEWNTASQPTSYTVHPQLVIQVLVLCSCCSVFILGPWRCGVFDYSKTFISL